MNGSGTTIETIGKPTLLKYGMHDIIFVCGLLWIGWLGNVDLNLEPVTDVSLEKGLCGLKS